MKIKLNHQEIELTPNISLEHLRKQNNNSDWWNSIVEFLEQWVKDSPTISIKTSGSTGTPKQMLIEKAKMWVSATKTCDFFKLNEKSTGLLCLSTNYIAGQMMLVRAMVSGMNLLCVEPSGNISASLNEEIDFAAMVPLQVEQSNKEAEKFNLIKKLIIGGGQVSNSLIKKLTTYNGEAYETFGMTETLSHIALKQLTPEKANYFKPLPGISVMQGFNDALVIDYPELGIYKLKTTDRIEIIDSIAGTFVWKGRTDFIINSGGLKVSPEEIERKIEPLINQPFCIVGIPDEKLGEKLVLVIEGESYNTDGLLLKLKENLSSYSVPKEINFVKEFPKTETGKIKRKKLFEMILE